MMYRTGRGYLSFSWYCRRALTETVAGVAAAVRIGDAIFGRTLVARILPAWAGTVAATLLNMAMDCVAGMESMSIG